MKSKLFSILLVLYSGICLGQKKITWNNLSHVNFKEKYFSKYDQYFLYPNFDEALKSIEGERVEITGYFLNISPNEGLYILSKNPMVSCFFCGGGGPQTAIELHFQTEPDFKTDDIVTVKGKLKLNSEDVDYLNFILNDCTAIKVE